jgi:hypothetical protein
MTKPITATAVEKMRRWAKQHARDTSVSYNQALEQAARDAGFTSWHEVQAAVQAADASPALIDLPVDPALPPNFDSTANERRSKAELDSWWLRPFAQTRPDGGLDVRCLDGGAWDRATYYGTAKDLNEAREIARTKLDAWQAVRDRPAAMLGESVFLLVLEPNRPGMPRPVMFAAGSQGDLMQVLARWDETRTRDPEAAQLALQAVRERSARVPTYEAVERALARGIAGSLGHVDGAAVGIEEVALVCTIHAFGGPNADVQFTLPELASYLWEFGVDHQNVADVFARARRLHFDGQPVIAAATSTDRDGVAHWNVRLSPTRWLVARGFRKF